MSEENDVAVETNGEENSKKVDNGDKTELESKIIRQVEYYFGDLNLPRDKYLRHQATLDDGWVPLDIMIKFNRLACLSNDTKVIADALKKSTSGLLEVADDDKKVRRNPELPVPEMNEERRKELADRTVYVKGFPKEVHIDDILIYFQQFEGTENIIMRKYMEKSSKTKFFKGSVFVTFKNKEMAEAFLNKKEQHKYKDEELLSLWQSEYLEKKQQQYAQKKEKKDKKNKDKEASEKDDFKLPTGSVFHFSEASDKMTREDVKSALTALGAEVAYIEFKLGDTVGWARLTKENSAKEISEKIPDGKIKIGDKEVLFRILEGEEEKTYLDKTVEEMSKRRKYMRHNKNNKSKNFKGKGGRKRKHHEQDGAPPNKVKADN